MGGTNKRRTVEPNIVLEASGKFRAYWTEDGKKKWGDLRRTIGEAREDRDRAQKRREVAHAGEETCDSFVERWIRDYPRSEQTNIYNHERVQKFGKDFAGRTLRSISKTEARQWARKNSGRLKSVRAMLTDAVEDGLADVNPFYGIRQGDHRYRRSKVVLTAEELDRASEVAEQEWGDYGDRYFAPMVRAAAFTGLRPGELYALRPVDIDYQRRRIRVERQWSLRLGRYTLPKNGTERVVPLLPQAAAAFSHIPEPVDRSDVLFKTTRGRAFTQRVHHYYWDPVRRSFWNTLSKDRQERIPRDFDFYELRHYFGTLLARSNFSAPMIAKAMGHTDGGRTAMEHYIKLTEDEAQKAITDHFWEQLDTAVGS